MNKRYFYPVLLLSVLALAGCSEPRMPQDVAEVFWQGVVEDDAGDVVQYSTLAEEAEFDGYKRDWEGVTPEFGRVVIDGKKARVVTRFAGLDNTAGKSESTAIESATYLLEVNDQWLVDYQRTGEALAQRPAFRELLEELETLGDKVKEGLSSQSDSAARKLEEMATEFKALSDLAGERLSELSEKYGDNLEKKLEELSRSIEEALEDKDSQASKDKETLHEAGLQPRNYNLGSS